jgi:hypothetical protein
VALVTIIDEEFAAAQDVFELRENIAGTGYFAAEVSELGDWDIVLTKATDRSNLPVMGDVSVLMEDLRPQVLVLLVNSPIGPLEPQLRIVQLNTCSISVRASPRLRPLQGFPALMEVSLNFRPNFSSSTLMPTATTPKKAPAHQAQQQLHALQRQERWNAEWAIRNEPGQRRYGISGTVADALRTALPNAQTIYIALECGTVAVMEVLTALRADNWLHAVADQQSPLAQSIKAQIRAALYVDTSIGRRQFSVGLLILRCEPVVGWPPAILKK